MLASPRLSLRVPARAGSAQVLLTLKRISGSLSRVRTQEQDLSSSSRGCQSTARGRGNVASTIVFNGGER